MHADFTAKNFSNCQPGFKKFVEFVGDSRCDCPIIPCYRTTIFIRFLIELTRMATPIMAATKRIVHAFQANPAN